MISIHLVYFFRLKVASYKSSNHSFSSERVLNSAIFSLTRTVEVKRIKSKPHQAQINLKCQVVKIFSCVPCVQINENILHTIWEAKASCKFVSKFKPTFVLSLAVLQLIDEFIWLRDWKWSVCVMSQSVLISCLLWLHKMAAWQCCVFHFKDYYWSSTIGFTLFYRVKFLKKKIGFIMSYILIWLNLFSSDDETRQIKIFSEVTWIERLNVEISTYFIVTNCSWSLNIIINF